MIDFYRMLDEDYHEPVVEEGDAVIAKTRGPKGFYHKRICVKKGHEKILNLKHGDRFIWEDGRTYIIVEIFKDKKYSSETYVPGLYASGGYTGHIHNTGKSTSHDDYCPIPYTVSDKK